MALSFRRCTNDLACPSNGYMIVDSNSVEPRLSVHDAAHLITNSASVAHAENVLSFVRPKDRRRVLRAVNGGGSWRNGR